MTWARAALERNPNLEVVATDVPSGVITVRDRRTKEVHALKLDEIAAVPVAQVATSAPGGGPTGATIAAEPSATEGGGGADEDSSATAPDETADAAIDAAPDGGAVASTPAPRGPSPDYTIERSGGRVKVSGPGVSIVSGENAPAYTAKGEPGQRTVDPIICEGERMMHFDGRDIYVDGDAITVRSGCELYITNSRIVASSTGVVVNDGTVHIANSYVEGTRAAFDAEGGARMYLRGSTFHGLSRRDAVATIDDQGGNKGLPTL
jgi:hypothetical protein